MVDGRRRQAISFTFEQTEEVSHSVVCVSEFEFAKVAANLLPQSNLHQKIIIYHIMSAAATQAPQQPQQDKSEEQSQ
jgi:hypothetical protein